jgi:AraC-like DNA-binding protein
MKRHTIESLRQQILRSAAVAKLQASARELIGGALLFLARHGEDVIEIHPSDTNGLPKFCQLYRSSSDGRECCVSCRSLLAFGACDRGTLEYSCHGGVRILATPARRQPDPELQLVVASCAFSHPDREEGWREFRDHASGLGIDLRKLRAAYDRIPSLTDAKRRIALSLIEIAASLVDDLEDRVGRNGDDRPPAELQSECDDILQVMSSALYLSRAQSPHQVDSPRGSILVDRIRGMVSHNPAMPFTLKNVAEAARVSPNHLSTIFHQHAGVRFSEFLLDQRITLAKRLLRDLSLNIETVAKRAGFPNSSYFSRRFRIHTGKTPSQWRSEL